MLLPKQGNDCHIKLPHCTLDCYWTRRMCALAGWSAMHQTLQLLQRAVATPSAACCSAWPTNCCSCSIGQSCASLLSSCWCVHDATAAAAHLLGA